MLVLSRKENQRLIIGDNVVVEVIRVSGGTVRLGIQAPSEVPIRREELAPVAPQDQRWARPDSRAYEPAVAPGRSIR